jgi:hypothetical protein
VWSKFPLPDLALLTLCEVETTTDELEDYRMQYFKHAADYPILEKFGNILNLLALDDSSYDDSTENYD